MLPLEVEDLTPDFLADALEMDIEHVEVVDRHSGTTGRARLALRGDATVPEHVFVKLPPFDISQREFVNVQGMGVAEARMYRDLSWELPVRVPRAWFADFTESPGHADDNYVMVLEDLADSGCRFPTTDDPDMEARTRDIVEQLAVLHGEFWDSPRFVPRGDLAWIAPRSTSGGDGGAAMVQMAIDNLTDRLPEGFRELAELYVARARDVTPLYREGQCTLVHGDPHLGNLFVDGTLTGFLDWAMIGRAPGIRDVAYVMCNSVPTELRRELERELISRYCARLLEKGITLDPAVAWEQYRLFAVYSWVAATCTAAMGSKWQPEHIGLGGTTRATIAAVDLDCVGLLGERLGS